MDFVRTLDDYGKVAWVGLMVASFFVFWPLGLAVLAFIIWSGRMGCRSRGWKRDMMDWKLREARGHWSRASTVFGSTGNAAFDEYREETLKRLEDEAHEFKSFLERLRKARDRAEFDQFMDERRNRPADQGGNGMQTQTQGGPAGPVPQAG